MSTYGSGSYGTGTYSTGATDAKVYEIHVEGITEDFEPGMYTIAFDVSPADEELDAFVVGTSALDDDKVVSY